MLDVTADHKCVPDFCRLCQTATENIELHVLEQHSTNLTTCPFCTENQSSLQLLEVHLLKHTQIKIKPSVCIGCKTKFMTSEGRLGHGCSALICKTCNIIYPSEEKLTEHEEAQHKKMPSLPTEANLLMDNNLENDNKLDVPTHEGESDTG
jgi:hypothetical protein